MFFHLVPATPFLYIIDANFFLATIFWVSVKPKERSSLQKPDNPVYLLYSRFPKLPYINRYMHSFNASVKSLHTNKTVLSRYLPEAF